MSEIIKVGMADWKVCSGQDGVTTPGGLLLRWEFTVHQRQA